MNAFLSRTRFSGWTFGLCALQTQGMTKYCDWGDWEGLGDGVEKASRSAAPSETPRRWGPIANMFVQNLKVIGILTEHAILAAFFRIMRRTLRTWTPLHSYSETPIRKYAQKVIGKNNSLCAKELLGVSQSPNQFRINFSFLSLPLPPLFFPFPGLSKKGDWVIGKSPLTR